MKRSSTYFHLKYVVECKPGFQAFFEPIVAFNSDRVALHYAADCAKVNAWNEYRTMKRTANGKFVQITKPEF